MHFYHAMHALCPLNARKRMRAHPYHTNRGQIKPKGLLLAVRHMISAALTPYCSAPNCPTFYPLIGAHAAC